MFLTFVLTYQIITRFMLMLKNIEFKILKLQMIFVVHMNSCPNYTVYKVCF